MTSNILAAIPLYILEEAGTPDWWEIETNEQLADAVDRVAQQLQVVVDDLADDGSHEGAAHFTRIREQLLNANLDELRAVVDWYRDVHARSAARADEWARWQETGKF